MVSYILDEVNELLKLQKGDLQRLNRIKELCDNNELIPISERKYVERLANQYLYKIEPPKSKTTLSPSLTVDNSQEKEETIESKSEDTDFVKITQEDKIEKTHKERKIKQDSFELSSRKKIAFGVAAIVLAVSIITIMAVNVDSNTILDETNPNPTNNLTPPYIIIETDEPSYQKADIISISGELDPVIVGTVRVSLENTEGKVIWAENVQVKGNGEFSTLVIAGGIGWENSGKYTLIVTHDNLENQLSFDFAG